MFAHALTGVLVELPFVVSLAYDLSDSSANWTRFSQTINYIYFFWLIDASDLCDATSVRVTVRVIVCVRQEVICCELAPNGFFVGV